MVWSKIALLIVSTKIYYKYSRHIKIKFYSLKWENQKKKFYDS